MMASVEHFPNSYGMMLHYKKETKFWILKEGLVKFKWWKKICILWEKHNNQCKNIIRLKTGKTKADKKAQEVSVVKKE